MKWRTESVFTWLLLLSGCGSCSMHSEFHAGTRSGSGGETTHAAKPPEHEHNHEHDHEQQHGRGDVVRVVRPQESGQQPAGSGDQAVQPADAKPAGDSNGPAPGRVGKPAAGAGSWSGVSSSEQGVKGPAQGGASGWSGAAGERSPAGEGGGASGQPGSGGGASGQPGSGGGASEGAAGGAPDASAGKDPKRESEPHYSRRRVRKKQDKEPSKGEGTDDKQVEQAPASPKHDDKPAEQTGSSSKRER